MGDGSNKRTDDTSADNAAGVTSIHNSAASGRSAQQGRIAHLAPGHSESGVQLQRPLVSTLQQRADRVNFTHEDEYLQFLGWCAQDKDAADFLVCLFRASHAIDDIADGEGDMLALLIRLTNDAMIGMPMNKFFQRHMAVLQPVMLCSLMNWYVSAKWEKKSLDHKRFAFVLRESLDQIIYLVAYLCGGVDHAMAIAENMMEFYHIKHGEDFDAWRA